METNPSNYFQWFKSQIKTILENNPDKKIYCNYNDWSGAIKDLYYNSSMVNVLYMYICSQEVQIETVQIH